MEYRNVELPEFDKNVAEAINLCLGASEQLKADSGVLYNIYRKGYEQERELQRIAHQGSLHDLIHTNYDEYKELINLRHLEGMKKLKERIKEIEDAKKSKY